MKIILYSFLFVCSPFFLLSQIDKKTEKRLQKADDKVLKKGESAKEWTIRGSVYAEVAKDLGNYEYMPEAVFIAYDSYLKALNLDVQMETAKKGLIDLYPTFINVGVTAYQSEDYQKSLDAFLLAQAINPDDTVSWMYGSIVAFKAEKYDIYKKSVQNLLKFNFPSKPQYYASLAAYYLKVENNSTKTGELLEKAVQEYPNLLLFRDLRIDYFLQTKEFENALQDIETKFAENPNDAEVYFDLGLLYEQQAKNYLQLSTDTIQYTTSEREEFERKATEGYQEAITYYFSCLGIDKNYMEARFNIAIIYFNQGVQLQQKLAKMTIQEFKGEESEKLQQQSRQHFINSTSFFEELYQDVSLDEHDKSIVIEALFILYTRLGQKEKASEMESLLSN